LAWCNTNPDNPDKEIYTNYINKSIPLKKWEHDIPKTILEDLANADEKLKELYTGILILMITQ